MVEATFENNTLLKELDDAARARFQSRARKIELRRGEILHNQGQPADRVYFPLTGLVAILSETLAGESVQTGMIGCDGAVGAFEASGSGQHHSKGLVQVPGVALRVSTASYRELLQSTPALRSAIERYLELQWTEARQLMACNALHTLESRLARAVLDALERSCVEGVLPLTQEALAQMLGAQRASVAVILSKLQRGGLIKNGRGAIEIRDKAGLERLACSCRETLQYARGEILGSRAEAQQARYGRAAPAEFGR